jgi:hypothetical protein
MKHDGVPSPWICKSRTYSEGMNYRDGRNKCETANEAFQLDCSSCGAEKKIDTEDTFSF